MTSTVGIQNNYALAGRVYKDSTQKLASGVDETDATNNAAAKGLERYANLGQIYGRGIKRAEAFFGTAKSALDLITTKMNSMQAIALSAASAEATDRALLQSQFKALQDDCAALIARASFGANKFFNEVTSAEKIIVGDGVTVSASLDPQKVTSLMKIGSIGGVTAGAAAGTTFTTTDLNNAATVPTALQRTDCMQIYGKATFTTQGMSSDGVITTAAVITLQDDAIMICTTYSAGSATAMPVATVNIFDSTCGAITNTVNGFTIDTDGGTIGTTIAANSSFTFSGQTFHSTGAGGVWTAANAATGSSEYGAVGVINDDGTITAGNYGCTVDTLAKAKIANTFVRAALDDLTRIATKITLATGSLETHGVNVENAIANYTEASSKLLEVNGLGEMSKAASALNNQRAAIAAIQSTLGQDQRIADTAGRVLS